MFTFEEYRSLNEFIKSLALNSGAIGLTKTNALKVINELRFFTLIVKVSKYNLLPRNSSE